MLSEKVLKKIIEEEKEIEKLKKKAQEPFSKEGIMEFFLYSQDYSEKINQVSHHLISLYGNFLNDISTPSGEKFERYILKCLSYSEKRTWAEIIPAKYLGEVFIVWAEELISNILRVKYKSFQLFEFICKTVKDKNIEFTLFAKQFVDECEKLSKFNLNNFKDSIIKLKKHVDNLYITFTPTNEPIQDYLNKVEKYIFNNEKQDIANFNYSKAIIDNWLAEVLIVNNFWDDELVGVSSKYLEIKFKKGIDLIIDIEKAIDVYKKGLIKNNSYDLHFLEPILNLIIITLSDNIYIEPEPNYATLAYIALENGEKEIAEYFFSHIQRINPDYHTSYDGLADTYRYMGEYEKSIIQAKKGLKVLDKFKNANNKPSFLTVVKDYNSLYVALYYNIALSSAYSNNFSEAIKYIDKAINLKTDFYGHKLDKFSTLLAVKEYINKLYDQFKDNIIIKKENLSATDPDVKLLINNLFEKNENILKISYFNDFTKDSQDILRSVFVFESLIDALPVTDYSIYTNQYFKVLEIELYERIIKKIEALISQNLIKEISLKQYVFEDNKFKKITLGQYKHILREQKIATLIKENFSSKYSFITKTLINSIEELIKIRNGSVHRDLTTKKDYLRIKKILFEKELLKKILQI